MIQCRSGTCLTLEPQNPVGLSCDGPAQKLNCHVATETRVFGEINFPHTACTDCAHNRVVPDVLSLGQVLTITACQRLRSDIEGGLRQKLPLLLVS